MRRHAYDEKAWPPEVGATDQASTASCEASRGEKALAAVMKSSRRIAAVDIENALGYGETTIY